MENESFNAEAYRQWADDVRTKRFVGLALRNARIERPLSAPDGKLDPVAAVYQCGAREQEERILAWLLNADKLVAATQPAELPAADYGAGNIEKKMDRGEA